LKEKDKEPETKRGNQQPGPATRVEIFDQTYNLRGPDAEYLKKLAEYVDAKMRTVAAQASTVDSLRVAVLAALNIADELHMQRGRLDSISQQQARVSNLSGMLDEVLGEAIPAKKTSGKKVG
jgi:cell division protein ZapA